MSISRFTLFLCLLLIFITRVDLSNTNVQSLLVIILLVFAFLNYRINQIENEIFYEKFENNQLKITNFFQRK